MARSKLREWQCVDDLTRMKRVKLLCHNGTYKTYRIKVVKSCKCARVGPRANRTSPGRRRRKGRRRKKDSNKTNSNKKRKKRRRRRKKKKHDRVRSRGGVVEGRQSRGRNSTLSTADDGDERPLGLS
ncbi:sclerostin domain-containing protein 1 [Plakobranchus ocellatus]|uniref:Sclerostin domain-containing protein 1 n=1 Tax=Plakobranchus ocellatus TaxID=259542 RepID=A0AAV4BJQ1_9GAST|nr:sclerostin domain-containing protein 1 [Plakobranchus ocellatus]